MEDELLASIQAALAASKPALAAKARLLQAHGETTAAPDKPADPKPAIAQPAPWDCPDESVRVGVQLLRALQGVMDMGHPHMRPHVLDALAPLFARSSETDVGPPSALLITLDGVEERLEIAFTEVVMILALNQLDENGSEQVFGEDLQ